MTFAQQGNSEQCPVTSTNDRVARVVKARQVVDMNIRQLHRFPQDRELPRGPFTLAHRCRHQHLHNLRLEALRGPRTKNLSLAVVLVDDARVRPGEQRRARDDRTQHRLQIEG